MTKDEALKLALEALESKYIVNCGAWRVQQDQAITAIEEALAQPVQEPVVWMYQNKSTHEVRFQKHMRSFVDHSKTSEVPLYSEPLANHELQCVCGAVWCGDEMVHLPNKAQPQRKPLTDEEIWDEVKAADLDWQTGWTLDEDASNRYITFARAIEAAIWEKLK